MVQTETDLSIMEAKAIALVNSCMELLPIIDLAAFLGESVDLLKDSCMYLFIRTMLED